MNHLSPFLLTLELLPKLLETVGGAEGGGEGRVVWVASVAHEEGRWNPDNLDAEVSFNSQTFYRNSKLYNVSIYYVCGYTVFPCVELYHAIHETKVAMYLLFLSNEMTRNSLTICLLVYCIMQMPR